MRGSGDTERADDRAFGGSMGGRAGPGAARPEFTPEREAALKRTLARMEKGLPLGMTRQLTRDEMHER